MDEAYNHIPIIKLWHLLLVPLQGEMTDDVAGRLMSEVLERIYRDGSSGLVIDITGLWILDSHLCSVLSQISDAAAPISAAASEIWDRTEQRWLSRIHNPVMSMTSPEEPSR